MPYQSHIKLHEQSHPIPTIPSPTAGELLTHGWGSHGWSMEWRRWWWWWRSPPNPRPGRVPERSFWFRIAVSDGGGAAEVYLGKTPNPRSFQVRGYMWAEGGVEAMAELASPQVGAARPGPRPWWRAQVLAPLRLSFWLRGSSGKIEFLQYFLGFFLKVIFLHKKKTPE